MKKILFLLLAMVIVLNCLASCNVGPAENTTGSVNSGEPSSGTNDFVIPDDETPVLYTVSADNADGLRMEVTVHGYKSESLNKDFYVKNNEYFLVDVKVKNTSDNDLYQLLPTECRNSDPSHNHEIELDLAHGDYKLSSSSFGFMCRTAIEIWKLEPGETYEWQLKLAAGEVKSGGDDYDLPGDAEDWIKLYGKDIYSDGICTFAGEFSFAYMKTIGDLNDFFLSVPLSVDVLYVSSVPNA